MSDLPRGSRSSQSHLPLPHGHAGMTVQELELNGGSGVRGGGAEGGHTGGTERGVDGAAAGQCAAGTCLEGRARDPLMTGLNDYTWRSFWM